MRGSGVLLGAHGWIRSHAGRRQKRLPVRRCAVRNAGNGRRKRGVEQARHRHAAPWNRRGIRFFLRRAVRLRPVALLCAAALPPLFFYEADAGRPFRSHSLYFSHAVSAAAAGVPLRHGGYAAAQYDVYRRGAGRNAHGAVRSDDDRGGGAVQKSQKKKAPRVERFSRLFAQARVFRFRKR